MRHIFKAGNHELVLEHESAKEVFVQMLELFGPMLNFEIVEVEPQSQDGQGFYKYGLD